jgi:hypothetical protein
MEKFLTNYLNKTMTKYKLFLMGKDVILLVNIKTFPLNRREQIEQDMSNYFGLTAHISEKGRNYKATILNVASRYFSLGKITKAHFEALFDEYDRYDAMDNKLYDDI